MHTDQNGQAYVEVKRGGNWQVQHVQTGVRDNEYTGIQSGLQQGDVVQA